MTFEEYRDLVSQYAQYPLKGRNMVYPVMGLIGEAGELCDKIKKHYRNSYDPEYPERQNLANAQAMNPYNVEPAFRNEIIKEMGDVLWYLNALANEFDVSLSEVAQINADKLKSRAERGVIKSQGDNR